MRLERAPRPILYQHEPISAESANANESEENKENGLLNSCRGKKNPLVERDKCIIESYIYVENV